MIVLLYRIKDLKIAQSHVKLSFLSIFGSGGPFTHDFTHVQAQIMPYFIKIKRVYFIVTCLIMFVFAVGWEEC